MQKASSLQHEYQYTPSGRRNVRRMRLYTLEQAITPKTCSLLPGENDPDLTDISAVRTMRGIYILCGIFFIGTGLYNVLF
jgi:hypothetical protein